MQRFFVIPSKEGIQSRAEKRIPVVSGPKEPFRPVGGKESGTGR
jgi:hypothetical protein